jgi:hypothetical protein
VGDVGDELLLLFFGRGQRVEARIQVLGDGPRRFRQIGRRDALEGPLRGLRQALQKRDERRELGLRRRAAELVE